MKYYSLINILKKKANYNVIFGRRSNGKSYADVEEINPYNLKSMGCTIVLSTHILSDVERICTDVAFLNGGVLAMGGKLSEIKKN